MICVAVRINQSPEVIVLDSATFSNSLLCRIEQTTELWCMGKNQTL